jgi:hypothetical protein
LTSWSPCWPTDVVFYGDGGENGQGLRILASEDLLERPAPRTPTSSSSTSPTCTSQPSIARHRRQGAAGRGSSSRRRDMEAGKVGTRAPPPGAPAPTSADGATARSMDEGRAQDAHRCIRSAHRRTPVQTRTQNLTPTMRDTPASPNSARYDRRLGQVVATSNPLGESAPFTKVEARQAADGARRRLLVRAGERSKRQRPAHGRVGETAGVRVGLSEALSESCCQSESWRCDSRCWDDSGRGG